MTSKIIVTLVGKDHAGIIAAVCNYFAQNDINILDLSMTTVQDFINMILVVDVDKYKKTFPGLVNDLDRIGEEVGWRGYMYPKLKEKFGVLKGRLIGGTIWGIWHWPLMIFAGYEYGKHYFGAPILGLIVFCVFTIAVGILLDELYDKTKCIWIPALGHGAINASNFVIAFMNADCADRMIFGPFQNGIISAIPLVITAIINDLGLIKSAGVGVAEKLCAFVMLIPSAYSQSMAAVVGQNIGAMRPDRARKALWCGIGTSLCAGVIIGYLSFFHGDILAGIFSDDEAVIVQAASYLKSYAIDCLFTSFLFCFIGYFCGLGSTVFVMIQGLVGAFCVRIPVSYFVSRIPNVELFYIGLATPSSTIVQIALCLVYFVVVNRKFRKTDIQSIN